jgi:hypothetical protein
VVTTFKVFLVLVVVTLFLFCRSAFSADVQQPNPEIQRQAEVQLYRKKERQRNVMTLAGGQLLEAMANATPQYTFTDALMKSFMKQIGVRMQIEAMADSGQLYSDPAKQAIQGFLIGL